MKKNAILALFIVAGFFAYFVLINLFAPLFSFNPSFGAGDDTITAETGDVVLGFGDSVTANVVRNRWYGETYENGINNNLYLFGFLKMPLRSGGRNLFLLHFLLIGVVVFGVYMGMNTMRRRAIERGIYY